MDTPELPVHYDSFKGSFQHRLVEAELSGEDLDVDSILKEFPEKRDQVLFEAENSLSKLRAWIEGTELDLSGAEYERKFELELPLGYVLVRKIDILTPVYSLDWKSGIKRNTMDYRIDLALNEKVLLECGIGKRKHGLVFLGGEVAEELFPFDPDKKGKATPLPEAMAEAEKQIEENIFWREQIKAGKVPPVDVGYHCIYCPYRSECRGV